MVARGCRGPRVSAEWAREVRVFWNQGEVGHSIVSVLRSPDEILKVVNFTSLEKLIFLPKE